MLCGPCNRGLGGFRDKEEFLVEAAKYIRKANNELSSMVEIPKVKVA